MWKFSRQEGLDFDADRVTFMDRFVFELRETIEPLPRGHAMVSSSTIRSLANINATISGREIVSVNGLKHIEFIQVHYRRIVAHM